MASRDDETMLCIVEEERRSHRRSRPARVPRYFQIAALARAAHPPGHQRENRIFLEKPGEHRRLAERLEPVASVGHEGIAELAQGACLNRRALQNGATKRRFEALS